MKKKDGVFRILVLSCLLMLVAFMSGCKKNVNPDGRLDVSGKITMNGQPIRGSATVRFDPVGDDKMAGGSARIDGKGNYLLTGQDGIKPGKYIVRISAVDTFDKTTNTWRTAETPEGREYAVRVVPRDFNDNSTLEFDAADGKKNVFNYDIVSDAEPERI